MATNIPTRSKRLTRDRLARIFGQDIEAIRAFEDLTSDVTETLPDAIESFEVSASDAQAIAVGARSAARAAQDAADSAAILLAVCRTQATALQNMAGELAAIRAELQTVRQLKSAVHNIAQAVEEVRVLTIGV